MLAIGVDIGGTKIAAGVVDTHGTVLAPISTSTIAHDPPEIEDRVTTLVAQLWSELPADTVGVAAGGYVSHDGFSVLFAPNVAWRDHPLRDRLTRTLDLPVVVENDANAAGWAEFRFGAGRGTSSMVMLTIGTGVGGAVIVDSHLVRGAHGIAGDVGHMHLVDDGHRCGCGSIGCWEQYASGSALTRNARLAATSNPNRAAALLALAGDAAARITGAHVTAAAVDHDPLSVDLLTDLGTWIGRGIATLVNVLDPATIVIGGGVATAGDLLLQPARLTLASALEPTPRTPPPIVPAQLGADAGIVGAADLARATLAAAAERSPLRPAS